MILGYMKAGFFEKILVSFLNLLNHMIYSLVGTLCGLFTEISNIQLFGEGVISDFTKRIYVILGIYMLFRLAISLLNSIINPDNFLDKEKGMQKIIVRSVIALVMLVLVPNVFEFALDKQNVIAQAVPRIIIGAKTVEDDGWKGQGEILAATALKAFIVPNQQCYGPDTDNPDYDSAKDTISGEVNDVSAVLDLTPTVCADDKDQFAYEFNGFISLVAGIFMIVSLAGYCIDIAIRSIKLGLLQLLAPIPIISYIDPKSEKDGAFSHWTKECISTYLEVFIKLAILYFVIAILGSIAGDASGNTLIGVSGSASSASGFAKVFLIIGAFFFMGKAADFICNIIGVKAPDKNSAGFLKKAAGLAGLGLATAGAASAGARAGATAAKVNGLGKGRQIMNAIGGGLAGGVSGGFNAANALANKKGFSDIVSSSNAKNAAKMRMAEQGGTFLGGVGSFLREGITGVSEIDALEAEWKKEEEAIKTEKEAVAAQTSANSHRKAIMDRVSSKAATDLRTTGSYTTASGQKITGNGFSFNSTLSAAKSGTGVYTKETVWYEDSYGTRISEDEYNSYSDGFKAAFSRQQSTDSYFRFNDQEINLAEADIIAKKLMDSNEEDYLRQALQNSSFDSNITSEVQLFNLETGGSIETKLGELKGAYGTTSSKISEANYKLSERSRELTKKKQSQDTLRSQANRDRFKAKR